MENLVRKCRENIRNGVSPTAGLSQDEVQSLMTRYARFDDKSDEKGFVVDSEVLVDSLHTPRPYLHLMASNHARDTEQWGTFWDQARGGFACVDTVLAGKMTSHLDTNYVPTAPEPQDVRDFWIHQDGQAWPMFPVPGYQEDQYSDFQCRLGLDRYTLTSQRDGLDAQLVVFVHPELPLEVWQVTLINTSQQERNLSWFSRTRINVDSYPFYYFVPRVVCEGVIEQDALVFLNHDKNNKHPRTAFFAADCAMDGYDMMAEVFDGGVGRAPIPAAVERGKCFNTLGRQPYAGLLAAAQFNATLAAGESKTWTMAFGKAPNDAAERQEFLKNVRSEVLQRGDECLQELADVWADKVTSNAINTPDHQLNRYYNIWSKYQARNQARFIRALDKMGYRDILQDVMGVTDFEAPYIRAKLIEALKYQYPDGRAVRQYEKHEGGGHDLRMYKDSVVWIPDTLVRYLKQTGDMSLLDEVVPYLDYETLQPSSTESGTIYDHACRAIRSLYADSGYHGLCTIGYGDWNDALSGIGGDKGVSVWLSCACVFAANLMAELAQFIGRDDDAREFSEIAETLTERINEHAWDGQWYIYAINSKGTPVGSQENAEGKIHLNVNTWSLFTGIAQAAGREQQVWDSVAQLATPTGHALLKPAYTQISREEVGRIADQMPGMFENGSIYTHGEAFYLYALACTGQADRWLEELTKTLPSNLVPDLVTGPPHQQSNFFVGPDHEAYGANLFSNFTGSLAWYRNGIEQIIGVVPEYDGLRIAPQVPSSWDSYQVVRKFRGAELRFEMCRGETPSVKLDGQDCGDKIPADKLQPGKTYVVEVTYV